MIIIVTSLTPDLTRIGPDRSVGKFLISLDHEVISCDIYIKIECVRSVRTCEARGRSTRVRLVGRPKNIVSAPACIYFAPRKVVRPNSIPRSKDDRFALPEILKKLMRH